MCYLLIQVFRMSLRGARRPLAREPVEENLKDDMIETNFSIDFSAISEYLAIWEMLEPNFPSTFSVHISLDLTFS